MSAKKGTRVVVAAAAAAATATAAVAAFFLFRRHPKQDTEEVLLQRMQPEKIKIDRREEECPQQQSNGSNSSNVDSMNSYPELAVLPEEVLHCIAQFADIPTVNKLFNSVSQMVAKENIDKITRQHCAGDDMGFKIRMATEALERIECYYEEAPPPPSGVFPSVQPRFLWHAGLVREHFLHCEYGPVPHHASPVVLPNGRDIAFFDRKKWFRIFNTHTGEIEISIQVIASMPPSTKHGWCFFEGLFCTKAEKSGNYFLALVCRNSHYERIFFAAGLSTKVTMTSRRSGILFAKYAQAAGLNLVTVTQ